jgi:threonine dehydrogenase-like Zn-dependent dehydrogenase
VLGHEAVVSVPGRPGRFIVYPLVSCGTCESCRRGEENLCLVRGLVGLDRPGVFADKVAVHADALIPVPDGMDPRVAVLAEPQAASVSALRQERAHEGTRLAIIGCGPIGLLAVHAASRLGIHPVVADPIERRRAVAVGLGATEALPDAAQLTAQAADLVLDAVGSESSWKAAIKAVRPGGSVVILGLAQSEGAMPVGDLVRRGVTVRGHYAYTREDFVSAVNLLAASPPRLDWLEFAGLDQGPDSFRRIVQAPDQVIKVILQTGSPA